MSTSVSVALSTYNGAEFVDEQLRSIAAQTRPPDQLVVCDDGSTDRTVEIVESFARDADFPVELTVNDTNRGVSKNFEAAIASCRGDLIFLADQDDVWTSEKVALTVSAFERDRQAGFAFSDALLVDQRGHDLRKTLWQVSGFIERQWRALTSYQQLLVLLSGPHIVYGNTLAFRRAWALAVLPIDTATRHMTHDTWIALLITALGARGTALDAPLVRYRQHSRQASGGMIADNAFAYHLSHHLRSRSDVFAELSVSFDRILERLQSHDDWANASRQAQDAIAAKRDHMMVRAKMASRGLLPRIGLAISELVSGRYSRYSSSYKSALKDIVLG